MKAFHILNSALLLGLLISGCASGGGSDSKSSTSSPTPKTIEVPKELEQYAAFCNIKLADLSTKSFKTPTDPANPNAASYTAPFGSAVVVHRLDKPWSPQEIIEREDKGLDTTGEPQGEPKVVGSFETPTQWQSGNFVVSDPSQIQFVVCLIEQPQGEVLRQCRYKQEDGRGTASFSEHSTTLYVALIEAKTGKGLYAKEFGDERDKGKKEEYADSSNQGCPANYRFNPDERYVTQEGKPLPDKQIATHLQAAIDKVN